MEGAEVTPPHTLGEEAVVSVVWLNLLPYFDIVSFPVSFPVVQEAAAVQVLNYQRCYFHQQGDWSAPPQWVWLQCYMPS